MKNNSTNEDENSIFEKIKLKCKKNKVEILSMVFIIVFAVFLSLGTNFSPLNKRIISHDSGIFSYMGFAMHEGKAIYKEAWDNKGPLLYIIYYIGELTNNKIGMYLLELLSIYISILFCYKTIKEITNNKLYSILGTIYTFSLWGPTFELRYI